MPKATISDFSGGITDAPFSSPENCFEIMENFLINKDKTASSGPGAEIFASAANKLPVGTRVSKWARLDDSTWIAFSGKKAYKVTTSAITEITGPSGNNAFNLGDANSIVTVTRTNNQLICTNSARSYPIRIWKNDSNVVKLVTAGLPKPLDGGIGITPNTSASKSYIYAFVWKYSYMVGTVLNVDLGEPYFKRIVNGPNYAGGFVNMSSLPVLANDADYNYDTTEIKLQIYRSKENGSSLYLVGEINNGTTTFFDAFDDTEVETLDPLYTNGGILPNEMPPASAFAFEANNTVYYGDYIDGTEIKPNRVIQAITNDAESVPGSFFTPFNSTAKGGGPVGRSPIVFTETETIRIDGILDDTGRGSSIPTTLSNTIGCIAANSVVSSPRGLYFASSNGLYFTDGVGAPVLLARKSPNSSKIDEIYKSFVDTEEKRSRIQGAYNSATRRVMWTMQGSSSDNDTIFVYDETHDSFTTLALDSAGIYPTCLLVDGEDTLIGTKEGYLLRLTDESLTLPVVNTGVAATLWKTAPLIYRLKTTQLNAGDGSVNKWWSSINVQGNPETNLSMSIRSYSNGEGEYKELFPLKVSPSLTWGDAGFIWGDSAFVWNRTSTMNQTRRFPAGRLRARHRAIEFTNAYVELASSTSDVQSRLTINATLKTATLVDPVDYSFGANNEGYDLVIGGVAYPILNGTADTLTLDDPDNTLVNGTYEWSIKGYGKGQRAHLLNYSVEFETLTGTGTHWRGEAS